MEAPHLFWVPVLGMGERGYFNRPKPRVSSGAWLTAAAADLIHTKDPTAVAVRGTGPAAYPAALPLAKGRFVPRSWKMPVKSL